MHIDPFSRLNYSDSSVSVSGYEGHQLCYQEDGVLYGDQVVMTKGGIVWVRTVVKENHKNQIVFHMIKDCVLHKRTVIDGPALLPSHNIPFAASCFAGDVYSRDYENNLQAYVSGNAA